jgi:hypothetical protein
MEQVCSICLEKINYYDLKIQKCCNNKFHIKCIHEWLKNKNTCPLCRSEYLVLTPKEYLKIKDFFNKNNMPNIMLKIDIFLSGIYLSKRDNQFIYFILVLFRFINKLMKI